MNSYNGFSPYQREKKRRALHLRFPKKSHPCYRGPCHMCGDPECPVAPHAEDYSEPFIWEPPAVYALCGTCHSRLHGRFARPYGWQTYLRHLRRGGFGSDLRNRHILNEVDQLRKLLAIGEDLPLLQLRPSRCRERWWELLSIRSAQKYFKS